MSVPRGVVLIVPHSKQTVLTMQTVIKPTVYATANRWLSFYSVGYSHLVSETSKALSCSPECPSSHACMIELLYHYPLFYSFPKY